MVRGRRVTGYRLWVTVYRTGRCRPQTARCKPPVGGASSPDQTAARGARTDPRRPPPASRLPTLSCYPASVHATPEGSWPAGFAERLARALGPEAAARALAAQAAPVRVAFRVSRLRATPEAALAAVRADGLEPEPVPGLEGVWSVPAAARGRLTHGRAAAEGLIYVQNPSSVAAVDALDPRPGEKVLDLCAAPGGKALLLAERVGAGGEVAAVEAVRA
ncbi:MAG TPA: hypothetical protein ENK20_09005, partial [Chromatiales bacterium]|nr:hypothetical protein [Chromatiales bacterium]